MENKIFTKQDSLAIKGVSILIMLLHHCFTEKSIKNYSICFFPFTQNQVLNIAAFCKICVSLFTFISGYGLWISYQKARKGLSTTQWTVRRAIKLLSSYWVVLVLSWIICEVIDGRTYEVYGFRTSAFAGLWNMLIEFLGLTNLAGGSPLNVTWWYMSAAMIFIFFLPILDLALDKLGPLNTLALLFIFPRINGGYPGGTHFFSFLPIFCIGMISAKFSLFVRWNQIGILKQRGIRLSSLLIFAFVGYKLFHHISTNIWWDVKYNAIPCIFILLIYEFCKITPHIKQLLMFIGKHATNIFLIHTFIYYYYCKQIIYGVNHFITSIILLLLISLCLSVIIERIKRIFKYDNKIEEIINKI